MTMNIVTMNIVTLSIWLSAFLSFAWGVFRFFRRAEPSNWRTTLVMRVGMMCAIWQAYAIATSAAGPAWHGVAIGLLVISLILFWSAVRACGDDRLSAIFGRDRPRTIVENGPYRYMRHPFYTSYTLYWIAGAAASQSLVSAGAAMLMFALYLDAIRREERKFADSPLAGAYEAYRRRAGAMWPKWPH